MSTHAPIKGLTLTADRSEDIVDPTWHQVTTTLDSLAHPSGPLKVTLSRADGAMVEARVDTDGTVAIAWRYTGQNGSHWLARQRDIPQAAMVFRTFVAREPKPNLRWQIRVQAEQQAVQDRIDDAAQDDAVRQHRGLLGVRKQLEKQRNDQVAAVHQALREVAERLRCIRSTDEQIRGNRVAITVAARKAGQYDGVEPLRLDNLGADPWIPTRRGQELPVVVQAILERWKASNQMPTVWEPRDVSERGHAARNTVE